jgi:hypothetical protein
VVEISLQAVLDHKAKEVFAPDLGEEFGNYAWPEPNEQGHISVEPRFDPQLREVGRIIRVHHGAPLFGLIVIEA